MRCLICGRPEELCAHTKPIVRISQDDEEEPISVDMDDTHLIEIEYLVPTPPPNPGLVETRKGGAQDDPVLAGIDDFFSPEFGDPIDLAPEQAAQEARRRVLLLLEKSTAQDVIRSAILHLMDTALIQMQIEGVRFTPFQYDIDLPPRRVNFSVRVRPTGR